MTATAILSGTSAQSPTLTMSSREIAELTGKNHADVLRDIRNMLDVLKKDASSFAGIYQDAYGRDKPCFNLDRDLTMTLVSGYDIELRYRVVTRLAELEAKLIQAPTIALPDFTNPAAAARAWADAIEQKQAIEVQAQQVTQQLALVAPKAEALDRIANSDGSLCLTDAAKTLQVQPRQFTQILQTKHWIYRRPMGSGWLAYQDRIQSGHLEHKVTTGEKSDGHEWTNTQVRVTAKGLTRLAQVLAEVAQTEVAA